MITPRVCITNHIRRLSYKSILSWYAGLVKRPPPEAPYTHIVQIGDPRLRTVADEIPPDLIKSPEIQFLINRMKKVMKKYKSVGLAAPQIGIPLRLFLVEVSDSYLREFAEHEREVREMRVEPFQVVINPVVKVSDYTKLVFVEGCESVRGFQAEVPRYRGIRLTSYDEQARRTEKDFVGWSARIVQHETDHLEGRIYTDAMHRKSFACSCWEAVNNHEGKIELPYGPN